jgi:UDP-N-acetylglucosamine:LPS N-acetylglucosamine transferase
LVVSTGALPGVVCILAARLLGKKTLWIDSIANSKKLSLSGKIAKKIAHKTLSQWPEVAAQEGVAYQGRVL